MSRVIEDAISRHDEDVVTYRGQDLQDFIDWLVSLAGQLGPELGSEQEAAIAKMRTSEAVTGIRQRSGHIGTALGRDWYVS